MSEVEVIRTAALAGLPHGFLGRRGGVSNGIYAGLNVGSGSSDDPAAVVENRRRAVASVRPGAALATVHQIHSAEAVIVGTAVADAERPRADALATDRPGVLLGILTADCAPVLLADRDAGVVAAAHAGWRGALGGVLAATVAAMERLGARCGRVVAAIGPCIARASYEVDPGFLARFVADDPANERFFIDARPVDGRADRHQFDLAGYAAHRLAEAGVRQIELVGQDTCADEARFFSYRRATRRGEPDYGRQFSLIGLAEGGAVG